MIWGKSHNGKFEKMPYEVTLQSKIIHCSNERHETDATGRSPFTYFKVVHYTF